MSPATLKTLREALGLSVAWLAAEAGVQERTVRYWETGRMAVPADVEKLIVGLEKLASRACAEAHAAIECVAEKLGSPREVVMVRYRTDQELWKYRPDMKGLPTAYHGAVVARVMRVADVDVIAEWLDSDAYEAWLKATKQKDSESLRAQFVALADNGRES